MLFGLLAPGDTILGMSLAEGGHLTHGMALNMSGKWFNAVSYGLDADEVIDYAAVERQAREHRPKLIIAGASAYSLHIDFERFAAIAKATGALLMVHGALRGLIADGVTPTRCRTPTLSPAPPQEPARAARRVGVDQRRAIAKKDQSAIFPAARRPVDARHRQRRWPFTKAGRRVHGYQQRVVANASSWRTRSRAACASSRDAPRDLMLVALRPRVHRKQAEALLASAHDLQQERHSERPAKADGHQRIRLCTRR